jgi:hypothetical protein
MFLYGGSAKHAGIAGLALKAGTAGVFVPGLDKKEAR